MRAAGFLSIFEYKALIDFGGPPVPINNQTVEAFYVFEGTLEIKIAAEWKTLSKGAFVVVPTGV